MEFGTAFLIIVVIFTAWIVVIYNYLVQLRENVKNNWTHIGLQLKRRHDLVPILIEIAAGYTTQERDIFDGAVKAGERAVDAKSLKDIQESENALSAALAKLLTAAESHPRLKADSRMIHLQEELLSTENRIAFARRHYNDEVNRWNATLQMFPNNLIAGFFRFLPRPYFEIKDWGREESPQIKS